MQNKVLEALTFRRHLGALDCADFGTETKMMAVAVEAAQDR